MVATTDGKIQSGMPAGEDAKNLVLLVADGTKVTIAKSDIEEKKESKNSVMPEGLLNSLSYQDIADLIALFETQAKK
jgi:putative heme-binding domain-containing protein